MTRPTERRKSQLARVGPLTPPEISRAHSDWPELFDSLTSEQTNAVHSGLNLRLLTGQPLDYETVRQLREHAQTCPLAHS